MGLMEGKPIALQLVAPLIVCFLLGACDSHRVYKESIRRHLVASGTEESKGVSNPFQLKLSFERGKKGKGHGKRTKREQKNGFCYFNALEIQSMQRSRVENRATLAQRNDSHHPTNATAAISIVVLEESHRFTNSSGGPVIFWLQQEISDVVESVVERLKTLSRKHKHGLPSCSAYTTSGRN
ncbi:hypothetical protein TB1_005596 [Malus domestica]